MKMEEEEGGGEIAINCGVCFEIKYYIKSKRTCNNTVLSFTTSENLRIMLRFTSDNASNCVTTNWPKNSFLQFSKVWQSYANGIVLKSKKKLDQFVRK